MVNTGLRDQGVCRLRLEWEYRVSGLYAGVFVIPDTTAKKRIAPLNAIALSIVEGRRGHHQKWVFAHRGNPIAV